MKTLIPFLREMASAPLRFVAACYRETPGPVRFRILIMAAFLGRRGSCRGTLCGSGKGGEMGDGGAGAVLVEWRAERGDGGRALEGVLGLRSCGAYSFSSAAVCDAQATQPLVAVGIIVGSRLLGISGPGRQPDPRGAMNCQEPPVDTPSCVLIGSRHAW